MGLGGGFFMTVYLANGTAVRIDQNICDAIQTTDKLGGKRDGAAGSQQGHVLKRQE